jgi:hypothetical protein
MTDKMVAEAVRRNADDRLQRAIAFVDLAVDAGMVHHLKTIPCFLINLVSCVSPSLVGAVGK